MTCPEEALHLVKKDDEIYPPSIPEVLYSQILAKKIELKGQK